MGKSQSTDTLKAYTYWQEADQLADKGEYEQAIEIFLQSAEAYKASEHWERHIAALHEIGSIYYDKGDCEQVRRWTKSLKPILDEKIKEASEQWASYHKAFAFCANRAGNAAEALAQFQKVAKIYKALYGEESDPYTSMLNNVAYCFGELGNRKKSLETYHQTLKLKTKMYGEGDIHLVGVYENLGTEYGMLGDFDKSLRYLKQSLAIQQQAKVDSSELASTFYNLSRCYGEMGDYDESNYYLDKGLKVMQAFFGEIHPGTAYMYESKAGYLMEIGEFERATFFLKKTLDIRKTLFKENHPSLINTYVQLARNAYLLDKFEEEKAYSLQAKQIAEEVFPATNPKLGNVYNSLGNAFEHQQAYQEAIQYRTKALSIYKEVGEVEWLQLARVYHGLGKAYSKWKPNEDQALVHLGEAINILRENKHIGYGQLSEVYQAYAVFYSRRKQVDSTLAYHQKALHDICKGFTSRDILQNPDLSHGFTRGVLLQDILLDKGIALYTLYEQKNTFAYLEGALKSFELAIELGDSLRRGYLVVGRQREIRTSDLRLYEWAIKAAKQMFDQTNETSYLHKAFSFAEKNKGLILLDALKQAKAQAFVGVSEGLLKEERRLKWGLAKYSEHLDEIKQSKSPDQDKVKRLEDKILELDNAYEALHKRLQQQYPAYYQLKYQTNSISLDAFQQAVKESGAEAALVYFWGDSTLYKFVIGENKLSIVDQDLTPSYILAFRSSFLEIGQAPLNNFRTYTEQAHQLYQTLVQAPLSVLDDSPERLLIIPDGMLGYIPFELLLSESTKVSKVDYRKLPYALLSHQFNYSYSATLFAANVQHQPTNAAQYVGFAPTYQEEWLATAREDDGSMLEAFRETPIELTGTLDEVEFAHGLFGGEAFLGEKATEHNFRHLKTPPMILHLAMHALVDNQQPLQSRLLFFPEQGSQTEASDGYLEAYEIYNMRLNARLAVLSACNTGYGKPQKGEGIMSLSHAFMYAGCSSILMSLWRAQDQPTSQIMKVFYQALKEGHSKDAALRMAKLAYLQEADPLKAHPLYWATFVSIGDPSPLPMNGYNHAFWAIIGCVFLGIGGLYLWLKYK